MKPTIARRKACDNDLNQCRVETSHAVQKAKHEHLKGTD